MVRHLTAIIEREDDMYVVLCPELDIASKGDSMSEVRYNPNEAWELFFETASKAAIQRQLHNESTILH